MALQAKTIPRDVIDGRMIELKLADGYSLNTIGQVTAFTPEEIASKREAAASYTSIPPVHRSNLP